MQIMHSHSPVTALYCVCAKRECILFLTGLPVAWTFKDFKIKNIKQCNFSKPSIGIAPFVLIIHVLPNVKGHRAIFVQEDQDRSNLKYSVF